MVATRGYLLSVACLCTTPNVTKRQVTYVTKMLMFSTKENNIAWNDVYVVEPMLFSLV